MPGCCVDRLRVGRLVLRRVGHGDVRPVGDEDVPPVPLPLLARSPACNSRAVRLRQGAQDAGGEAAAGVAVAGRVGRAGLQAAGGPVGDDPRHGVAAAVVVAEDLGEEAPDGRDRAEHPVAVPDAVLVEGVADAGLGQDVGEREAVVAREAGAELIQARPGSASAISGRDDRDGVRRVDSLSDHTLYYDDLSSNSVFGRPSSRSRMPTRQAGAKWWAGIAPASRETEAGFR